MQSIINEQTKTGSSFVTNARLQQSVFMLARLPAFPTPSLSLDALTIKVPVSFISVTVELSVERCGYVIDNY